jgi:hypothetical protein
MGPTRWCAIVLAVVVLGASCSGSDGDGGGGEDAGNDASDAPAALPDAALPETFGAPAGPACEDDPARGTLLVTADCVDPELAQAPYVDVDEEREATDPATGATVRYRYVHGGFTGTEARFSLYFPATDDYEGRFFQSTYPTVAQEDAEDRTVAFAISHGAYVVSTNNAGGVAAAPVLGGYRVNAAAAKFSRQVAAELYGDDAPARGYLHGASGGAYQTIGGLESTEGVWDGGVPMVPGTPNSIPSFQGVQLLGLRVLGDDLAGVVDALAPGGSGDPAAGLDAEQRAVLDEVTAMGFPPEGWWQHETLDGGSFYAVAAGVKTLDPTYVDDFWSVPGYEGADPASSVRAARVTTETTIAAVDGDPPTSVTLADVPDGDLMGADLVLLDGEAAGRSVTIASAEGAEASLRPEADPAVAAALRPGTRVRVDNSWFLALQYYHRHQVPEPGMAGWDQFRDDAGNPVPPQRPSLVGTVLAGVSGGVATGRFRGKMIMLASTLDVEAFPWSADWYHGRAEAAAGDGLDDTYRLWFMDNADHTPPKSTEAEAHIVAYTGEMEQALLDLDAWVAEGIAPPPSSTYEMTDDNQVVLPDDAERRGGVQPVVDLAVAPGDTCEDVADEAAVDVSAGDPVTFSATAVAPPGTGDVVRIEWDHEGTGDYGDATEPDEPGPEASACATYTYDEPGTYLAVARVTTQRDRDAGTTDGLVQNLARARVTVG